jgi:hypothetical protein
MLAGFEACPLEARRPVAEFPRNGRKRITDPVLLKLIPPAI